MPSKSKSSENGMDDALANVSATQREAAESFMEISQAIFNGGVAYNQELSNFMAGRVVSDLELQQQLVGCQSIEDVMKLQSEFLETALQQYSDEAQKLATISADVIREDLEAIGRHIKLDSKCVREERKQSA